MDARGGLGRLHLDFDVDAGGEVEVHERINSFAGRLDDVDKSFVSEDLVVLLSVFIGMGRGENGDQLSLGRQRDGANNFGAGS